MDKLTAIKIKYIDGTYSDEIPLSAIAQNIDWDSSHNIVDILGNVEFSTKGSIQTQINNILAQKGSTNGIATLDSGGKVPSSQLPSYVDDVLEYSSRSTFPSTGESGKIYIALDTNLTYRWSGSAYVEISPSLALGETSSTAYRGDRGKTAYDHATDSNRLTTAHSSGLYKIGTTAQGHIASVTNVVKSDITALGISDNGKIFYGTCDTSSYTQTKAVTLSDSTGWSLTPGVVVSVKFSTTNTYNSTSSSPGQLNVNNSGTKNIYYGNGYPTGSNPMIFGRAHCINQYVYDGTYWVWCGTSADAMVGQGYGIDSRSSKAAAVTATLAGYILMNNGIVVIKFNYDVPDSATLNINNQGAKAIYYNDAPIIDKIIKAGYTATFIYNDYYRLIAIDRGGSGGSYVKELTQAQYDSLTEEEKMDDVIYLIQDSPDNYLDEVFGDFASVEYTNTASKAYAIGDYLVYNNKFYKVTSAIAQGGTITVGTNVVQTNVGDELDDLNSNKADKNVSGTGYCKMSDGTMICWGGESNRQTGDRITFPISFVGIPSVTITPEYNTQTTIQCIFSCAYGNGNTGFNMYAWDITTKQQSTSTTLGFRWTAIGRWK